MRRRRICVLCNHPECPSQSRKLVQKKRNPTLVAGVHGGISITQQPLLLDPVDLLALSSKGCMKGKWLGIHVVSIILIFLYIAHHALSHSNAHYIYYSSAPILMGAPCSCLSPTALTVTDRPHHRPRPAAYGRLLLFQYLPVVALLPSPTLGSATEDVMVFLDS